MKTEYKKIRGMKYCRVRDTNVYSCDHYICNEQGGSKVRGMKYCKVRKTEVYSCDHYECK